jgi:hypothetical protein
MSYTELTTSHPKGRKDYSCEWCGEKIPKGEQHLYRSYIFDGDFNSGRMHLECERAMYKTPSQELSEGWCFGSMQRGLSFEETLAIEEMKAKGSA